MGFSQALVILEGIGSLVQVGVLTQTNFQPLNLGSLGTLTVGDLRTILPFLDPTVVLELDANNLWDALESGLSMWPAQEG
jgi:hypothetical protein